ncbi:MAG: hypothetical protein RJA36_1530 [Pseudomonadota bacterium]|jgi:methyl-accepting chemotaxis protein
MNHLKIGARLALALGAILLLLIATSLNGVWRLHELSAAAETLGTRGNAKLQLAQQWHAAVALNWVRTKGALLDSNPQNLGRWKTEMEQTSREITDISSKLKDLLSTDEELKLIEQIKAARGAYTKPREQLFKRRVEGADVASALQQELASLGDAYVESIERMRRQQQDHYERDLAEALALARRAELILAATGVAAVALATVLAVWLTRSIVVPIRQAADCTRSIAAGDLTLAIAVQGRDEVAELLASLRDMQASLRRMVAHVRQGAEGVSTASSQIAQGNHDLAERTSSQASSLEEAAASMEEFSTAVRHNAEHAGKTNELVQVASQVAVQGGEAVARVVGTMKDINASSKRIADIISVIDGIAFQTNILALNAAVEAARAGEQGRGFAVVASEVRALAQRSTAAAKEIAELISDSVRKVAHGTELVDSAGATMDEVVSAINRVTTIMAEIIAASREQETVVAQVSGTVSHLDQVTQQNAGLVEEVAGAADQLRQDAGSLVQLVAQFRT